MSSVEAVIAVEETLVALNGASRQSFEGVTFSYATWLRPGQGVGYVEQQAGACNVCPYGVTGAEGCGENDVYLVTPGNIAVTSSSDVNFTNCSFSHLGAYAASAGGGSQFVAFRGCSFADVSAGAIMLGDTASYGNTDIAMWDANFTVADCTAINSEARGWVLRPGFSASCRCALPLPPLQSQSSLVGRRRFSLRTLQTLSSNTTSLSTLPTLR